MRHRDPAMDTVLTWFSRAIFCWLVLWGVLEYVKWEWMMWK